MSFPTSITDHPIVQEAVHRLDDLGDPRAGQTLTRCLNDTLARTIRPMPDGTAFVVTGDIPAMWLRDSSTQMMPYLALLKDDTALQHLLLAVLRRQFQQIAHDPYANAFNAEPSGRAHDPEDLCGDPWVWEQKYEVDSLAFPCCWPTVSGRRPGGPTTSPGCSGPRAPSSRCGARSRTTNASPPTASAARTAHRATRCRTRDEERPSPGPG